MSALKARNYQLFASGQLISVTGSWMGRVAADWLVLDITNSATALGVVMALQFAPTLLLTAWGGMLADRGNKRRLLIWTQTALALTSLVLGVLDLAGVITFWQVALLAFVQGIFNALDTPIRHSFIVEMVGKKDLPNAVGLNSSIFNTGRIVGPAVAGVIIAGVGIGWTFVLNAGSSVAVIGGLALMRKAQLHPSIPVQRAPGQLREALRYVRSRPDLLVALLLVFIIDTFGMNFQLTASVMAKHVFHGDASDYGVLSTALGVGSFLGAVLATRRSKRPSLRLLFLLALAFGVLEIFAGLMPTFTLEIVALAVTGFVLLSFTTAANSSVQMGVAATMRGRVMALYLIAFLGGTPIDAPLVGALMTSLGPRWGLIAGGVVCVVATAVLALVVRHPAALTRRRVRLREADFVDAMAVREAEDIAA